MAVSSAMLDAARASLNGVPGVPQGIRLQDISDADRARQELMVNAWRAYHGQWGDGPLKVTPGLPDLNVRTNRCAPIVDTGVSFLFGANVSLSLNDPNQTGIDNGAEAGTSPAQVALAGIWGHDDSKMSLLTDIAMNGGVCGSAFVEITAPDIAAGELYPTLSVLDPQTVTMQTDPRNVNRVLEYWIEWTSAQRDYAGTVQETTYRRIVARIDPDNRPDEVDADAHWTITDYERRGQGSQWTIDAGPVGWPYPEPPIQHCKNLPNPGEAWGVPDLPPDIIAMNRALHVCESNTNKIIYHHGHPWPYATGVEASAVTVEPGRIIYLPPPDARMGQLELGGDLVGPRGFADDIRSAMDEGSQVPAVAIGRMKELPRGALSGVTIRALYQPLMSKTIKKRRLYGALIRSISLLCLKIMRFTLDASVTVELAWGDPMPADDLAEAQTLMTLGQIGVSTDTLITRAGLDPDTERRNNEQAATAQQIAFSRGQGMPPVPAAPASPLEPGAPGAPSPTPALTGGA